MTDLRVELSAIGLTGPYHLVYPRRKGDMFEVWGTGWKVPFVAVGTRRPMEALVVYLNNADARCDGQPATACGRGTAHTAHYLAANPDEDTTPNTEPEHIGDHFRLVEYCGHCGEPWSHVSGAAS